MKTLHSDDLEVGKKVTVLQNLAQLNSMSHDGQIKTFNIHNSLDRSHMGEILEIVTFDLPYVIIKKLSKNEGISCSFPTITSPINSNSNDIYTLDMRYVVLGEVSEAFINAKMGNFNT